MKQFIAVLVYLVGALFTVYLEKVAFTKPSELQIVAPEVQYRWIDGSDTLQISSPITIAAGGSEQFVIEVNGDPKPATLKVPRSPGYTSTKHYEISGIEANEGDKIHVTGSAELMFEVESYAKVIVLHPSLSGFDIFWMIVSLLLWSFVYFVMLVIVDEVSKNAR